jgi:hypothetical protein
MPVKSGLMAFRAIIIQQPGNEAADIGHAIENRRLQAVDFRLLLLGEQLGRWAVLAGQVSPPVSLITTGLPGEFMRSRSSNDLSDSYQPKYSFSSTISGRRRGCSPALWRAPRGVADRLPGSQCRRARHTSQQTDADAGRPGGARTRAPSSDSKRGSWITRPEPPDSTRSGHSAPSSPRPNGLTTTGVNRSAIIRTTRLIAPPSPSLAPRLCRHAAGELRRQNHHGQHQKRRADRVGEQDRRIAA